MKSPETNPPVAAAITSSIPAPTQKIAEQAISGMELETSSAPTLTPPARATEDGVTAAGAAVSQTDKRVTALYTTHHARNAWMHVPGLGWKRLSTTNDSSHEAMNLLASHCREKACRVDFVEDNGLVSEMYVW